MNITAVVSNMDKDKFFPAPRLHLSKYQILCAVVGRGADLDRRPTEPHVAGTKGGDRLSPFGQHNTSRISFSQHYVSDRAKTRMNKLAK